VSGKTLVDQNVGNNDAIDSDAADIGNNMSQIDGITVVAGQDTPDNDAGVEQVPVQPVLGSIGDRVWLDEDKDGIQDANESGAEGVSVSLKDASGNILETTTTDANGNYLFDDLSAGNYSVDFEEKDGFDFTTVDAGNDDNIDSDANVDTGMTGTITLNEGQHRRDVDAGLIEEPKAKKEFDFTGSGAADAISYRYDGIKLNGDPVIKGAYSLLINKDILEDAIGSFFPAGYELKLDILAVKEAFIKAQIGDLDFVESNLPGQDQAHLVKYFASTNLESGDINTPDLTFNIQILDKATGEYETVCFHIDGDVRINDSNSPIAFDLNDNGEIDVTGETTSIEKDAEDELGRTVEFDIDADGDLDTIEWFDGSGDGILVDTTKIGEDGSIDGSALFGDEGGKYANGYEKLEQHDANGDGMISGEELEGLGLWVDDGDAVLEDGEMLTAEEAGIASISTDMKIVLDDDGKQLMQSSATTIDGEEILTEDVWFAEVTEVSEEMTALNEEMNQITSEDVMVA
jgi:hypothetical protein